MVKKNSDVFGTMNEGHFRKRDGGSWQDLEEDSKSITSEGSVFGDLWSSELCQTSRGMGCNFLFRGN